MLDVLAEGLGGGVCPAGAEGAGGQLALATGWGCPTVPSHRSPSKQDAWLMTLLETMPSPATEVGSTSCWRGAPLGPAMGTCISWGRAGPSWSAVGTGTACFSDGRWSKGCEAAWGLRQRLRSPQAEKVHVNSAWPFGDRA